MKHFILCFLIFELLLGVIFLLKKGHPLTKSIIILFIAYMSSTLWVFFYRSADFHTVQLATRLLFYAGILGLVLFKQATGKLASLEFWTALLILLTYASGVIWQVRLIVVFMPAILFLLLLLSYIRKYGNKDLSLCFVLLCADMIRISIDKIF